LAESIGVPAENILIPEIGRVMEFTAGSARFNGHVPSGQVFVDGLGVGKIGDVVLRDRQDLSQDGVLIAVITVDRRTGKPTRKPELASRGFLDAEDEPIMDEAREHLYRALQQVHPGATAEPSYIQNRARDSLQKYIYQKTKRRPMVIGLVVEV
jgi:ribonuclease J